MIMFERIDDVMSFQIHMKPIQTSMYCMHGCVGLIQSMVAFLHLKLTRAMHISCAPQE